MTPFLSTHGRWLVPGVWAKDMGASDLLTLHMSLSGSAFTALHLSV